MTKKKGGVKVERLEPKSYESIKELASMTEIIKSLLMDSIWNFCYAGYYLKQIKDRELYKIAGFNSIGDYAKDNFGFSPSVASRYMDMNTKFSVDGNSIEIREEFKRYNKSQMQEMLYLNDDQIEQVTPEMTVKQIREIRTPEVPEKEKVDNILGQMMQRPEDVPGQINVSEWDNGAYVPDDLKTENPLIENVDEFKSNDNLLAKEVIFEVFFRTELFEHQDDFIETYNLYSCFDFEDVKGMYGSGIKTKRFYYSENDELLFEIVFSEKRIYLSNHVKKFTTKINWDVFSELFYELYVKGIVEEKYTLERCIKYFYDHMSDKLQEDVKNGNVTASILKKEFGNTYNGFTGPGEQSVNCSPKSVVFESGLYELSYSQLAMHLVQMQGIQTQKLSASGLLISQYPDDSLISSKGCGNKHTCFSCAMDCEIRQEHRWCTEAPCGNPFDCTTMNVVEMLSQDMREQCEFINSDLAYKRAGDNQPSPCCKHCTILCGYRCNRSGKQDTAIMQQNNENHCENAADIIDADYREIGEKQEYPESLSKNELTALKDYISNESNILQEMSEYWKQNNPSVLAQHETVLMACELMLTHGKEVKEEKEVVTYTKDQIVDLIQSLTNKEKRDTFLTSHDTEFWNKLVEVPEINAIFHYMDLPSGSRIIRKNKINAVHINTNVFYLLDKADAEFSLEYQTSLCYVSDKLKEEKELLKRIRQ